MRKTTGILLILMILATAAFADIKPPIRPAPTSSAVPADPAATEARLAISVSRFEDEATLVIHKSMIDKINAALKAKGAEKLITGGGGAGIASTQTIVGGLFLSLALVFGGVWLARAKGPVSKPALGIVVFAIFGMGATLVIGNVPPPKRIPLTSAIIDDKVLGRYVAAGKVKILIPHYESDKDDIVLVLPKRAEGGGEEE
jgi:hypothetical protein